MSLRPQFFNWPVLRSENVRVKLTIIIIIINTLFSEGNS